MNEPFVRDRGREWEHYFFGLQRESPFRQVQYVDYESAVSQLLNMQGNVFGLVPQYPVKAMTKSLIACTKEFLQLFGKPYNEVLRLYCALGTSLDMHHGIDGFFVLGNRHIVTFDLTARLCGEKTSRKADVIIERSRCKSHEMWRVAKELASRL